LQQTHEAIGQDLLRSLSAAQPQPLSMQEHWATYINQIDAIQDAVVLVLDDYHRITTPEIHEALTTVLEHPPHNLHLVIATRADPPLPLARLRGRGQLTELRQADLCFSPGEVAFYVTRVMGMDLPPQDITVLSSRTEGWVTALQMAALAVQGRDRASASAFLATLSGRHEHIVDYFVDEVLSLQPRRVQAFLLRTSILNELSGSLCDAVCETGMADADRQQGRQVLERLREANLFVVALDDERRWYRYHHLFADLLRQRLHHMHPDRVPELHRRASQWYEAHGFVEKAIEHALRGDDASRAALLVERAAEAVLMRGELVTLTAWFEALPLDLVRGRPLLSLYYAGVLLLNGAPPARVRPFLPAAAEHDTPDAANQGAVVLRALLALWQGDVGQSIALGRQALASLPEENLFWRSTVAGNLGIAYLYSGADMDLAERMLDEAVDLGGQAGNVMGTVIALCNLAELRAVQGQLDAARARYEQALALTARERRHPLPIGNMAIAGMARLLHEWNRLQEAEGLLAAALDPSGEPTPIGVVALDVHLALARVRASRGEIDAAQDAIEEARRTAAGTGATQFDDWVVDAEQARLWIAQGRIDLALRWAEQSGIARERAVEASHDPRGTPPHLLYELEHLVLAELWMARGEPARALGVLETLLRRSRALRRTDTAIKALVRMAVAHRQLRQPDQALAALAEALALGQPSGYVRAFVDQGPDMAPLLCQALAQGVEHDYVQRLLAALPGTARAASSPELVEPLSDRELQVLRLLATHLTNAEIGEQLFVSVNTVRFHVRNVYAKLDVHTRSDAVQHARELGLL
jgi:LuxR family maltose regulon positive regulatory protein